MSDGSRPVGLFVDRYPVLSETFVAQEAAALAELGHPVSVEPRRRPEPGSALPGAAVGAAGYSGQESRGARVAALAWLAARHPIRTAADVRARRRRPPDRRGNPVRRLAVRARRLAALGPDVHVHTHFASTVSDEAYRVARLIGASSSVTAHAWDIYIEPSRLRERIERCDFATSGCEYTVADLRRIAPAAAGRIHVQVMGVDHTVFSRTSPLPGTRHVLAVGRLVPKKGFTHLVRAMAELPDVRLTIVGEGPERPTLEAEVDRLALADRVSLPGAASPGEIRALLDQRADLLCTPCVVADDGDRDSMPVVVKEAMAMELCVVASDEVGLPELVRAPWGTLVPPAHPGALAAAIQERLALDARARAQAGAAAREFVKSFADVRTETAKLSRWIEQARS